MHLSMRRLLLALWLQNGLEQKVEKSRKQKKERRNRARVVRGVKKNKRKC